MKYKAILRSSHEQPLEEGTVILLESTTKDEIAKEISNYMKASSEYYCTAKVIEA